MKTYTNVNNQQFPACIIAIYLREAYKKRIGNVKKQTRIDRMIGFNIGMLRELYK